MTNWARARLNIRGGEAALFGCALLLFFLIRSSGVLLNNYAETAFLKRFGVEHLPYITAINAVVTFFAMGYLAERSRGVPGARVLSIFLVFSAAAVLLCRLAIPLGVPLIYPFLYVLKTQFEALLVFFFWNWANDVFDTRQSKRLFPLITSGGLLGSVFSSVLTPHAARWLAADNLLVAYAALAAAGALAAQRTGARFPSELTSAREARARGPIRSLMAEFGEVGPFLRGSKLAQVLLVLTLVPNIVLPIVNYQFSFVVDQTYNTEGGMIGFYGYFRGVQYTISLLLSLVAARVYGRFGLPVALMFHPFNYCVAACAYLLRFDISSAMYATLSAGVLRSAIHTPAVSVLYGLFPRDKRTLVRAFLRGTVVRVGILAGSGAVLWSQGWVPPRFLSVGVLALGAVWLGAVVVFKRNYTSILVDLIRNETLDVGAMEPDTAGEVFRGSVCQGELMSAFRGANGEDAVWYGTLLRELDEPGLDTEILEKLTGEDDPTRIRLLELLSPAAGLDALPVFRSLIDSARPELMIALAHAVVRLVPNVAPDRRKEIFDRAELPEVKACLLPGLIDQNPSHYQGVIDGWLASADLAERRAGVMAAREVLDPDRTDTLSRMLDVEADPGIVSLLLRTLGTRQPGAAASRVVPYLKHPDPVVREAALDAVVLEDDDTARAVVALLGDTSDTTRERALAKLEGTSHRIGPVLVEALGTYSRRVQDAVFRIAESLRVPDGVAIEFYLDQLRWAQRAREAADDLAYLPGSLERDLLMEHLEDRQRRRVRHVLRGLAAFDSSGRMRITVQGITSGDPRRVANGIEALENAVDGSLAARLVPFLEPEDRKPTETPIPEGSGFPRSLERAHRALQTLLNEGDGVTRLLARHLATHMGEATAGAPPLTAGIEDNLSIGAASQGVPLADGRITTKEHAMADPLVDVPHRILWLRKVDLFTDLEVGELAAVAQVMTEERFRAGETIAGREELGHRLGVVVEGSVSLRRKVGGDGGSKEYLRVPPGGSFGEVSLFRDVPPGISVQAHEDVHLLLLDRDEFEAVVKEYPEVALGVCRGLSQRLAMLFEEMEWRDEAVPQGSGVPCGQPVCPDGTTRRT
ncbi:MAG: cyclic nucleotide-binding domain-containing protein [Deferrisomatales bacterium]|nr:cyclic nucleotide-binding domain-containing protein [Deferrisomatales bacterium]